MIKNTRLYLTTLLQRHPLVAGLAVAVVFTVLLNLHSLFAVATLPILLSVLPCLVMAGMCMKNMKGKTCEQEAAKQPLLSRNINQTTIIDQENRHA
ncbi:hypothetical protein AWM79_20355 [Pseudomonas agarici]|uniref:DUF2933 domain-containing protein n=1 Tax=Pseudomonas agarici TaxID=46677 RepID=A0A0X1T5Z2_PSEAA|nr:hypothetical protein [Pseudomonas agarici]AMB87516.1 hypothetical protein AWM79_20355 [Pseudomonas agarici]